jgi:hypothetical protein
MMTLDPQLDLWMRQASFRDNADKISFLQDLGIIVGEGVLKIYESHLQLLHEFCPDANKE